MTIVNNHTTAHSGLLVTGTGDDIDIDVELIGGRTLRMSAAGDELGTWPIEECRIEDDPTRDGSFRIVVDGEDAVFTPEDPAGFRVLVALIEGQSVESDSDFELNPSPSPLPFAGGGAASKDDPVAFLFGSSSPPPIHHAELADFEDFEDVAEDRFPGEEHVTVDDVSSTEDSVPASIPDFVPPVDEEDQFDVGGVQEPEAETLEASAADATDTTDDAEKVNSGSSEFGARMEVLGLPEDDLADIGSDLPEVDDEADLIVATGALETNGEVADGAETASLRSRFGGSTLGRLSSVRESVTTRSPGTDADGGGDEDEEDYVLGPNTVAEEALTAQRTLREHQLKDAKRSQRVKIAMLMIGVAAVIGLFAVITAPAIEFIQNYEGGAQPPPTLPVSETTVPSTTVPEDVAATEPSTTTSPLAPVGDLIFDKPSPEFVAAWDGAGGPVDQVLEFDTNPIVGPFEERFTPFLSLVSVVQPNGTLDEFTLVIDPSGPAEYDRVGIQALGVAIATVEPARTPQQRASLLGELGLNVQQPLLEGINGTVESAGISYTLVYDEETTLLTLTVAPAN